MKKKHARRVVVERTRLGPGFVPYKVRCKIACFAPFWMILLWSTLSANVKNPKKKSPMQMAQMVGAEVGDFAY